MDVDREPDTSEGAEAGGDADSPAPSPTGDFLGYWSVDGHVSCASWNWYFAPGDSLWLGAEGFAPYSVVEFVGQAVSLQPPEGKILDGPQLSAGQADGTGTVQVMWTIPAAPPVDEDSAPRLYGFEGTGVNQDGGVHTVSMLWPVASYPATGPCAQDDAASTSFGVPVNIAVLDNDIEATANTETHLEDSFSEIRGGTFSADTATGIVTFQPSSGFIGTAAALYWTYVSWGIRTRAHIEVEVTIDCSIDSPVIGGVVIVGTEGDDVICVPDRDRVGTDGYDPYNYLDTLRFDYLIDAKGGDDIVVGGDGDDLIYGGEGDDMIFGRGGRDRIVGGPGADIIDGGDFDRDEIHSADPEDTFIDSSWDDLIDAQWSHILVPGPFTPNDLVPATVSETVTVDVHVKGSGRLRRETLRWASAIEVRDTDGGPVLSYRASDHVPDESAFDVSWIPAGRGVDIVVYEICDTYGACTDTELYAKITRP